MEIIFNGRIFQDEHIEGLDMLNRAFHFGDAFFDTLRFSGGKLLHWDQHYRRITDSVASLRMELRNDASTRSLDQQILNLLNRQRLKEARVRITVFRSGKGLYRPQSNMADILIESKPLSVGAYLDGPGLLAGISQVAIAPLGPLSHIKSSSRPASIQAAIECGQRQLDELLILNTNNTLAEAISSNVFLFIDGILYMPMPGQGQVEGIMQELVSELAAASGIPVQNSEISTDMIHEAEQAFLTNSIRGIRPVSRLEEKPLEISLALKLQKLLRESLA